MIATAYVSASKEAMYNLGEKIGLAGNPLEVFRWALGEVEITLDVDPKTGLAEIIAVNGQKLGRKETES